MKLKIKKLHPDAILPKYAHPGDAGLDIYTIEDKILAPSERYTFKTGIAMEFDPGYVALIKDRSGLAAKQGLTTFAGVIEYTYRGELGIVAFNSSNQPIEIKKGDKIAQMLIMPIITVDVEEVQELSETIRGTGGFGSTGKR
ncbi:MAG: dUTP diphosphatase [Candidatus Woesearchaeota archaeon]